MKRAIFNGLVGMGVVIAVAAPLHYAGVLNLPAKPGWNQERTQFTLPNGWRVSPAGRAVSLPGDMPASILFVDGGRKALVNTCGYHDHSLNLVDLETGKVESSQVYDRSWIGLAQAPSGEIWVSGGRVDGSSKRDAILRFGLTPEGLVSRPGLKLADIDAKDQYVSTILVGPEGAYVVNIQSDQIQLLGADGSVRASAKVGYRPYAAVLSPDGSQLAVSLWGEKSVCFLDARTLTVRQTVAVEAHPAGIAYAPDGRLFVTNAGSNTVSVIAGGKVRETVETGIDPKNKIGATPVAIAISPDGMTAYVANAGNNCVAVLDISRAGRTRREGLIPTERYPSAVAVSPDGKRLLIGTAKGFYGPNAGAAVKLEGAQVRGEDEGAGFKYIAQMLSGRLAIVEVPGKVALANYTKQVYENNPIGIAALTEARDRKRIEKEAFAKIKHVIYVIRENRTYDQVLGDIPKGNGDSSLTIFGEKVTPNGHKIANTFGLFDNLYCDGEVSTAGHQWTDAAYANDYAEKQWLIDYAGKGELRSDTRLTSSPGDYIWSLARKKGLSARVFGEYVDVQEDHGSLESEAIKANPEKYGYSASFEKIFARGGRDTEKVADFLGEMREAESTGNWPNLMVMALPEDHTHGFSAGANTPQAMVANNDWAIGQLVDAVSHSKFWKETAIFIIQDDAQAGPDHVDAHRTVGYVVSPYARRGIVDHTMYATSSYLRTMELILGLPPMTEYDAKATPMHNAFSTIPDYTPYTVVAPLIDVNAKNPARTALARRSAKLDFTEVDRVDADTFNRLLWDGLKPGVPYPGARSLR